MSQQCSSEAAAKNTVAEKPSEHIKQGQFSWDRQRLVGGRIHEMAKIIIVFSCNVLVCSTSIYSRPGRLMCLYCYPEE